MKKTLDDEDRHYLVRSYEAKALEALEDARDFLHRRPGLSARMSYEAAYHFTAALFVSWGIPLPRTHRGMNSELYRNFVDKGLFAEDVASCLGRLEKDRSTAQYDPIEKIEPEEAEKDLEKAEQFCATVRELIARQLSQP